DHAAGGIRRPLASGRRDREHRVLERHRSVERERSARHRHILAGDAPVRHRTPPAAVLTARDTELQRHQLAAHHRRHAPEGLTPTTLAAADTETPKGGAPCRYRG